MLGCALFTAYGAVRHGADLRGGERVAVVAAGGVGVNVIQIARAFGASQIIAIDVSDDKLEIARRVGATDVINAKTTNAADRVRELTDGRGVDIAFEVLGRETFMQALEIIGDGGRMVAVGIAPGGKRAPIEITRVVRGVSRSSGRTERGFAATSRDCYLSSKAGCCPRELTPLPPRPGAQRTRRSTAARSWVGRS